MEGGEFTQKKICVYGNCARDYIVYMSYIIRNLGCRVLVCDYDSCHSLKNFYMDMQADDEIHSLKNVDFCTGLCEEKHNKYDVIFIYYGPGLRLIEQYSDELLIINDADLSVLEDCFKTISKCDAFITFIVRNTFKHGISAKYLKKRFALTNRNIKVSEIVFDEMDFEYSYKIQYERMRSIRHISQEMERSLVADICHYTGKTPIQVAKAVKSAKEGKTI